MPKSETTTRSEITSRSLRLGAKSETRKPLGAGEVPRGGVVVILLSSETGYQFSQEFVHFFNLIVSAVPPLLSGVELLYCVSAPHLLAVTRRGDNFATPNCH